MTPTLIAPMTRRKYSRILKCARELLSDPKKWIQDSYAETERGEVTDGNNPNAVRFCALGAIQHCQDAFQIEDDLAELLGGIVVELYPDYSSVVDLNDRGTGHQRRKILRVFKEAIKRLET